MITTRIPSRTKHERGRSPTLWRASCVTVNLMQILFFKMINSNLDVWRPVSFCNQCLKKALVFQEVIAFKTWRNKLSELKTVPLSRIARENLVNYDDATIYHNDKNPGISWLFSIRWVTFWLKKLRGNLRVFLLTNVWWVEIYFTLTICLTCTRCNRERQRKVNIWLEDRLNWAFRVFIYVPQYPISHKNPTYI